MTHTALARRPLPRALHGRTRTCFAPAKINLALYVVGRREDGYHELDGLVLPLAWGDTLTVALDEAEAPEVDCVCENQPDLSGSGNLAARAAATWLLARGLRAKIRLRLTKKIWTAAGLGGGSSDAAATLIALETLLSEVGSDAFDLSRGPTLKTLALELGADVPFFLDPRPARVQGIGELCTPLVGRGPARLAVALLNPGRPLATPEVFAALGFRPGDRHPKPMFPRILPASVEGLAALIHNDLETPAVRLCPSILRLRRALMDHGARVVGLSGSGPTVFGLFDDPASALSAAATSSRIHGFSSVSTTLSVS